MEQIEQDSESEYKEIEDLTEKVKEKVKARPDFLKEVEIKEAKLLLSPYDSYYIVYLKYNIDGVDYISKRPVYVNLKETVNSILFDIEDFYERMHKLE